MLRAGTAAVKHGTNSTYCNYGCRCPPCRTAHTEYCIKRRRERMQGEIPDSVMHGRATTNTNWGCHCEPCMQARRDYEAERRRKR